MYVNVYVYTYLYLSIYQSIYLSLSLYLISLLLTLVHKYQSAHVLTPVHVLHNNNIKPHTIPVKVHLKHVLTLGMQPFRLSRKCWMNGYNCKEIGYIYSLFLTRLISTSSCLWKERDSLLSSTFRFQYFRFVGHHVDFHWIQYNMIWLNPIELYKIIILMCTSDRFVPHILNICTYIYTFYSLTLCISSFNPISIILLISLSSFIFIVNTGVQPCPVRWRKFKL